MTKRLEHCLAELAKRKDSEMLTTAFRESFSRSRRRHAKLIEDLADKQAFTFVIAEAPLESNPERVTRLVSYRLSTSKKSRIYTFALTVDDKVAGLDTED